MSTRSSRVTLRPPMTGTVTLSQSVPLTGISQPSPTINGEVNLICQLSADIHEKTSNLFGRLFGEEEVGKESSSPKPMSLESRICDTRSLLEVVDNKLQMILNRLGEN